MGIFDKRSKEEKELEQQQKALDTAEKEKEHIDNIIEKMNERLMVQLDISRQKAERQLIEAKLKNPDAEYRKRKEAEDEAKRKEEEKEGKKARR